MNNAIQTLSQLRQLLQVEYACEREAFRRQTEAAGIARQVRRGDAWLPVTVGRAYYNSLGQPVVELSREEHADVEHNFEYGRPVVFFTTGGTAPADGRLTYLSFGATVSYAEDDRMVVVLPDISRAEELRRARGLGVQLSFDETTYRLMFEALDRVIRVRDGRLAYLRDLFGSACPAARHAFAPVSLPWLNASQERAVAEVLAAKDVAIVHGPPGTGKTTTLVEAIYETLRREGQVLVCAQSNMAVDWISERLVDRGLSVLRLGNPTRVDDKMLSFTYERRFEAHPDYPQLWSLRKAIRELRATRRGGDARQRRLESLRARATELEVRIGRELFDAAKVVACTLAGAGSRLMEGRRFATLFVDEAAQALEPACWIALAHASRVVLAGDHCQLPPTVKSIAALKGGLGRTLMERVARAKPDVVSLLDVQYRMNEAIMRFSSEWFYGGRVKSAPEVRHRGILDYDDPMVWIDTTGLDAHEEFVGETYGRINREEARLTLSVLAAYFEKVGRRRVLDERIDVGVISPYRAQVQLLRRMIRQSEALRPYRRLVSVGTVDGFQGQERDVVVISLVRANAGGEIGFLRDLRRMNVAITRARMKLIILGDAATLAHHPFYRRLREYVDETSSHPAALPVAGSPSAGQVSQEEKDTTPCCNETM